MAPATAPARPAQAAFAANPVPVLPGVLQPPSRKAVAPYTIRTRPGNDYYVKLVDGSGKTTMTMYVRGGVDFETKVPIGVYEMRYASGKTWYGFKNLFGPETIYAKTDKVFNFRSNGQVYSGFRVELIEQDGGNLTTSQMPADEF